MIGVYALALLLAFIVESMVEYIFAPLGLLTEGNPLIVALEPLKYVALLVGVLLAFAYQLDVIAEAFPTQGAVAPWVGIVLTGLAIGRGANYIHDLWTKYLRPTPAVE